jgi:hypothetical protein
VVAHDNIGDVPPPADENADLTVDAVGQLREGAGEFMGEDAVRRDAPAIEPLDGFDVFRPQAGGVAEDFVYSKLLLLKLMRAYLSFHVVEELGPEVGPESGHQLFHLFPPAFGTLDGDLFIDLVEDFKFMGAFLAPVLI